MELGDLNRELGEAAARVRPGSYRGYSLLHKGREPGPNCRRDLGGSGGREQRVRKHCENALDIWVRRNEQADVRRRIGSPVSPR